MNETNPQVSPQPEASSAPTAQPAGPSVSMTPPALKKKRKGIIIGSIVAGALLLLGGGGALAYNLWYQNPDKVVHDAIINALRANSVTGAGTITAVQKGADGVTVNVTIDGASKGKDGSLNAKVTIKNIPDLKTEDITVSGSAILKGDTYYVKVKDVQRTIDQLSEAYGSRPPEYVDMIVKKIDNKWISIKSSDYSDISSELAKQQTCMTEANDLLVDRNSKESREIIDLYKKNQIITATEKLGSKDINGVGSLGYKVDVSKVATVAFVRGLDDTAYGKALKKCDASIDFKKASDEIAKTEEEKDASKKATIEIWASRFGHELTRVAVSGNSDELTLNAVFDPVFNKDVKTDAPSDATSIKDLMKDIQEAMQQYQAEQMSALENSPTSFDYTES